VLTRDPGAVVSRLFSNTGAHLVQAAKQLWLLPLSLLALVGLAGALLRRPKGAGPVVAYFGLVYASLVPVFYADRYHLPLVPAAAAFAALALAAPGAWLGLEARRAGKGRRALATALGAALVLTATIVAVRASIADAQWVEGQVPAELPAMARALRADWHGPGAPRLIARKPHMSYYAGAVAVAFVPLENLEALARYAHEERADYLFVSWPEAELRPPFAFLLVPGFAPPGLDLVAAAPSGHAVLYRVRPEFGQTLPAWYPREWEWRAAEGMTHVRPNDPKMWLRTAQGRHARRDYSGAMDAIDLALRMQPGWGDAYFERGNLEAEQGDDGNAMADFDRALAGGATSPRVYLSYAVVLHHAGQEARANDMLRRYVALTHDTSVLRALGPPPPGAAPAR
jgi:tetratricopeptide (TPR) repeat protein